MEIDCHKHSRINIRARKRSSRAVDSELTDTIGGSHRREALGPNAKVSTRPLNQPLSPTIIENTGLTQEMRILEISDIQDFNTASNGDSRITVQNLLDVEEISQGKSQAGESRIHGCEDSASSIVGDKN